MEDQEDDQNQQPKIITQVFQSKIPKFKSQSPFTVDTTSPFTNFQHLNASQKTATAFSNNAEKSGFCLNDTP